MKSFFFFIIFFFFLFPLKPVLAESLLIVEAQIAGDTSSNDFIKIYNPGGNDLDVSGFKLRKRASTGSESSIRVFPKDSLISSKGFFIWANSKGNFAALIGANAWSTTTLAKNNSIALLNPEGQILDTLAWGESQNPFLEGQPFPGNPAPNQKLTRKKINEIYQDTNNNSQDFYLNPVRNDISNGVNPPSELEEQPLARETDQTKFFPSNIFINEILPSPLGPDDKEEWTELFNKNNFEVDLSGWKVLDKVGRTTAYIFPQGTKISPLGFLVLTRPETKITLNNDGDGVLLFQPDGKLVDEVNYQKAPTGQSFARKDSQFFWTTTLTPGKANIITEPEIETEEEIEEIETKKGVKKEILGETTIYPSGIFLNEILPSPTGPDEQEEWIEIFNSNDFEVDLSGWKIQDTKGKTKTYTFPKGTKISPQGFLVLSRPTSKITLNNDGDGLNLIQPDGKIIDSVIFGKAPQGESYNRVDSDWVWSSNLTPGATNNIPQITEEEEIEETAKTSEKGLTAIGQKIPKFSRSFFVFFIALAIAIFSGIIILILKKKLKIE